MNVKAAMPAGLRVVALLLAIGGAAGVVAGSLALRQTVLQEGIRPSLTKAIMGMFLLVFGSSVWTGIALWRRQPWSVLAAQVLFIAQIPVVTFPKFSYYFLEGLSAVVQFTTIGASKIEFEFQLLSSFKLEFFGESEGIVVGINFVAVAALVYLARYVSQDAKRQQLETNATESKA